MVLAEELIRNNLQYRRTQRKTWRNHEERDNLGIVDIINLAPQLRATFVTKRRNDGNIINTVSKVDVDYVMKGDRPLFVQLVKMTKV